MLNALLLAAEIAGPAATPVGGIPIARIVVAKDPLLAANKASPYERGYFKADPRPVVRPVGGSSAP